METCKPAEETTGLSCNHRIIIDKIKAGNYARLKAQVMQIVNEVHSKREHKSLSQKALELDCEVVVEWEILGRGLWTRHKGFG